MLGALARSAVAQRLVRRVAGRVALNHLVRMVPVAGLVHETGGRTVLDVGSGSDGIRGLLDRGWSPTSVDASFDDYGAATGPRDDATAVLGDVRDLRFADASFDVVVAVDLLEHLEAPDRDRAIDELARVARLRVIVACPAGEDALAADRRLAAELADPPRWLAEHLANGFPEPADLEERLGRRGAPHLRGNEHVHRHERLVRAELSPLWFAPTRAAARTLLWAFRRGGRPRAWSERMLLALRGGDAAPTYRTIAWVDLASSPSVLRPAAEAARASHVRRTPSPAPQSPVSALRSRRPARWALRKLGPRASRVYGPELMASLAEP